MTRPRTRHKVTPPAQQDSRERQADRSCSNVRCLIAERVQPRLSTALQHGRRSSNAASFPCPAISRVSLAIMLSVDLLLLLTGAERKERKRGWVYHSWKGNDLEEGARLFHYHPLFCCNIGIAFSFPHIFFDSSPLSLFLMAFTFLTREPSSEPLQFVLFSGDTMAQWHRQNVVHKYTYRSFSIIRKMSDRIPFCCATLFGFPPRACWKLLWPYFMPRGSFLCLAVFLSMLRFS